MSKIELPSIANPSNVSLMNDNFKKIEDALNEEVLYRNGYVGEPNEMQSTLDMNSNRIINLLDAVDLSEPVTLRQLIGVDSGEALELRADLAAGDGSSLIGFTQIGPGSVLRTAQDKMREDVSVKDFGAIGDGVVIDNTAIQTMITAYGFARFTTGNYRVTTATLDAPVIFENGAYLSVDAANTLSITNSIESSRQWIFRGAGSYVLGHDTDSGENARQVHASWFGAFPSATVGVDQAPFINKAMTAVGNARESVLLFDVGNYNISSQVLASRGVLVKGAGTRRTVFKLDNDGYSVFKTDNVAVKFEGIQFELHSPLTSRASPYIEIAHGECSVEDAYLTAPGEGILVTGSNSRINNIMAVYGVGLGVGSSLIHIAGGSNNHIDGVLLPTSQFAPEAIVRIGGSATTVSGSIVNGLTYVTPGIGVLIDAAGTVGRTTISEICYNGGTAAKPDSLVTVRSSGAALVETVRIDGLTSNSNSSAVLRIEQGSSAEMRDILVSNVVAGGATAGNVGDGIVINKTGTGALKGVILSDSINVRRRLNQLTITPTSALSESYISPSLLKDVAPSYVYTFSVPNDTAVVIDFQRDMFIGRVDVCAGVSNYGQFAVRAAPTPSINNIAVSANLATLLVPLTGTTGTAGKLTVAPQPKQLYIENRLGTTQTILCVVSGSFA